MTTGATLPVLSDDDARWYFSLEPDAGAPTEDDSLPELTDAQRAEWERFCAREYGRARPGEVGRIGGARWWCGSCGGFVASPSAMCAKCHHWGPHHFSEDNPHAGNAQRRARLRREHSQRRTIRA
jgi:hypothetical protein